jgi:Uma2 family endonuclease
MPMPAETIRWTAESARALPDDGNRYEVLDGELVVTPAPTLLHQRALLSLIRTLDPYVSMHRLGELLTSPADIEFSRVRLVQPDLFVAREAPGTRASTWRDIRGLVLVVEVLSPSTARADRNVKSRIYMEEDVEEYWIVDLTARVVERWRKGESRPEILRSLLEWKPSPDSPSLVIDLDDYFAEVLDA